MSVMSRFAALDRRTVPERTPDAWRKAAGRWRLLLVAAAVYVVVGLLVAALLDSAEARAMALGGLMPMCVLLGYSAGQQKAEDDRLNGRDPLAKRRPPGV